VSRAWATAYGGTARKMRIREIPASSLQRKPAEELMKVAGITIPEEDYGIREIEQFQRILASENIAIIMIYNFSTFDRESDVRRLRITFLPRSRIRVSFKYNVLRGFAIL